MPKNNDGSFQSPNSVHRSLAIKYCQAGDLRRLDILLKLGLNLNAIYDNEGSSLLTIAARDQYIEIAKMLIKGGANVNARNNRGYTPLGYAAYNGSVFMSLLLIQSGADTEADMGGGLTAYMLARMFDHERTATVLLASGANPQAKTAQGEDADSLALLMH